MASNDNARPPGQISEGTEDSPDEPVVLPIEDSLDLHPFSPRDVRSVALDYLEAARDKGLREVRLIHGRGIGVQREIIRSLLKSLEWVEEFHDADPGGGGWGATVVTLREFRIQNSE